MAVLQFGDAAGAIIEVRRVSSGLLDTRRDRLCFLGIAACFVLVGSVVFLLTEDARVGLAVFAQTLAAAVALIAALATLSEATWGTVIEHAAIISFGAMTLGLFSVFPIDRSGEPWVRPFLFACCFIHMALIVAYAVIMTTGSSVHEIYRKVSLAIVIADFLGAGCLLAGAAYGATARRYEARRIIWVISFGAFMALGPFAAAVLIPELLGREHLIPADVAILSIVLLPVALGAAVLSRRFLGIARLARRSVVALTVWFGLLGLYTVGHLGLQRLGIAHRTALAEAPLQSLLTVAFVASTFSPLQGWLRRALERRLFHDVYCYAETLERFNAELGHHGNMAAIAEHALSRLGLTLNLSWATLTVQAADVPERMFHWGACPPLPEMLTAGAGGEPDNDVADRDAAGRHFPLESEGRVFGTLVVGPKRRNGEFSPDDATLVSTIAPLVATALQNVLLLRRLEVQVCSLREREGELAELSGRLMRAQEDERRRIALDLHDDVLQRTLLLAREVLQPAGRPPCHWHGALEEIATALRATCVGLRPAVLDDFGLAEGVAWLADDLRARSELVVRLDIACAEADFDGMLDAERTIALYRVAQEALNNVLKHAAAATVTLALWRDDRALWLRVADDGRGIGHGEVDRDRATVLGLLGMRERLRPWAGTVDVRPGPAGGTVVTARLPLGGDHA